MRDVVRVVGTWLRGKTELGADESGSHFRDDLLGRMRVRAESISELAIQSSARA